MRTSWIIFFVCLSAASAVRDLSLGSLEATDDEHMQQYDMMENFFPTIAMDAREGSAEMIRPVQFTVSPPAFDKPVIIRNMAAISADPLVKIVGPENSGTNFLFQLLKQNNISSHGHDYNQSGGGCKGGCLGWKHWPLQYAPTGMTTPDMFGIMLARHPLSWLLSMQKNNYDVDCKNWDHFQDCTFDVSMQAEANEDDLPEALKSNLDHEGRLHFNNLIQLWNLYYSGYLKTNTAGVIVRYEDLLVHPEIVLKRIGEEVNVDVDVGAFSPVLGCAKGEGTACVNDGFAAAKHYNIDRLYMTYYRASESLLKNIDQLIDHSVLNALGYRL